MQFHHLIHLHLLILISITKHQAPSTMHQAIQYKSWAPLHSSSTVPLRRTTPAEVISEANNSISTTERTTRHNNVNIDPAKISNLVSENAVIVFSRQSCCMGDVVKILLVGHGVNPTMHEVDETEEVSVTKELEMIICKDADRGQGLKAVVMLPAVFIGGKMFGGLERVIGAHISGELVPILKQAGALWL